jgi:GDP-mannose 6-dehydrogenase
MRISIFGLGYVGCVSAACFPKQGVEVIGVDLNQNKIQMINEGRSPIIETGVQELIAAAVRQHKLTATDDAVRAVAESDLSFICVGTPGKSNGSLDLAQIRHVCQQIGSALEAKNKYHIIAIRSTIYPGTTQETIVPILEIYSGKREGVDFGVAVNPEFLREGTAIYDFNNPPFTLVGANTENAIRPIRELYDRVEAKFITAEIKEIEAVKYACNCFHALKITFANEFGNVCKQLGIDSHRVLDIFCQDTKLNLSSCYLSPGFAFGGSCLPKDLRAIVYKACELDVHTPMLNSILTSNHLQIQRAIELILQTGRKYVGVLGLSFKSGTDDLRESPMVVLIEALLNKGISLSIYDKEVGLARLMGTNRNYIEHQIPHISRLMKPSMEEVIEDSEVVVIGKGDQEFLSLSDRLNNGLIIIDLVRLLDGGSVGNRYEGLCW